MTRVAWKSTMMMMMMMTTTASTKGKAISATRFYER